MLSALPGLRFTGKAAPWWFAITVRRSLARRALGVLGAFAALHTAPAQAQSANLAGTVALGSQLVDRGMPVTRATPIVQGALSWSTPSGWSAGLSTSSEAKSPGRFIETLAQVARSWSLSDDWQMQSGVLYYRYSASSLWRRYDRAELGTSWIYRDVLTVGVSAAQLIRGGGHGPRLAADAAVHWPLADHLSLTTGVGSAQYLVPPPARYHYQGSTRYTYGHAGLIWDNGPWRFELDRIVTHDALRVRGGNRLSPWNATIARSF